MATYGCLLLFFGIKDTLYDFTSFDIKWRVSTIIFIFSFVFPVLNIFILYRLKRIPSLTLSNQRDRTFPYVVTSVFYFGLFYLLLDINLIWSSIKLFIVGAGLAILITAIINIRTKISAHMVGIGGLLGVIVSVSYLLRFDMTLFYVLIILVAGLIGFARLVLEEHKPFQIYSGFLLGFFIQAGLFFVLQKMIFA
jgi:hypothetical protein